MPKDNPVDNRTDNRILDAFFEALKIVGRVTKKFLYALSQFNFWISVSNLLMLLGGNILL